jgi:hypothetical protein
MSKISLGCTGLLVVWASVAAGADFDEPAFRRALQDPNFQNALIEAAKKTNVVIADGCPNAYVKVLDTVHVELAPQFAADGHTVTGSWVHDIFYAGCHVARSLHVLVEYAEGKKPGVSALFPGNTHAGPVLQKDVFNSAYFQSYLNQLQSPACQNAYVDDTAFLDRESTAAPGAREPAWREAWTVSACDKKDVVIVMYRPDSAGTKFRIIVRRE